MINYSCYSNVTGQFLWGGSVPKYMFDIQSTDEVTAIEGVYDPDTQYVDLTTGKITDKPTLTINQNKTQIQADGVDEWVLSDLPVGSSVTWPDGEISIIDDGEIIFSVDLEGVYIFKIDSFPYLKTEVSIEAIT